MPPKIAQIMATTEAAPADRALFPISLSNQRFSSDRVGSHLASLIGRYDELVFFVADGLQLYNKAMLAPDHWSLEKVIAGFAQHNDYAAERRRWVKRLMRHHGWEGRQRWRVLGIADISDAAFLRIYRNVLLCYCTLDEFNRDVRRAAQHYARHRNERWPFRRRRLLSECYILEEIALSIRLHVFEGIVDEYYLGDQLTPLLNLYAGQYDVSVWDLADADCPPRQCCFYRPNSVDEADHWVTVLTARP